MASFSSHVVSGLDWQVSAPTQSQGQDLRSPKSAKLRRGSTLGWFRVLAIILLDCFFLTLSRQVVVAFEAPLSSSWYIRDVMLSVVLVVVTEVCFIAAGGFYKAGRKRRNYLGITWSITIANAFLILIGSVYPLRSTTAQTSFAISWILSVFTVCLGRFLFDFVVELTRKQGAGRYPVFVFCHPADLERATSLIERENRYDILGWTDLQTLEDDWEVTVENISCLGASEVFLCAETAPKNAMFLHWKLRNAGITLHLMYLSMAADSFIKYSEIWQIGGFPSFTFSPPLVTGLDFWVKRSFDFLAALILLVVASPVYLLIAIAIKLDSPGPIFYKQTRIGLNDQAFKAWKFRTMVVNAAELQKELEAQNETKDGILFKIKDDPRVTRVGKFLRRYSLDELPQVFNVLFGEMSLVGPRPLPVRDVEKFSESHFVRHKVLPGITGLWQVSGRSDIDNFDDVINLDRTYIEKWSLLLDIQIIFKTIGVVLQKTGAY
jgi:exopolysaccharide biosynthesis polyprenyl glycosylphosphotransferase